jgi:hypothetical protein
MVSLPTGRREEPVVVSLPADQREERVTSWPPPARPEDQERPAGPVPGKSASRRASPCAALA